MKSFDDQNLSLNNFMCNGKFIHCTGLRKLGISQFLVNNNILVQQF